MNSDRTEQEFDDSPVIHRGHVPKYNHMCGISVRIAVVLLRTGQAEGVKLPWRMRHYQPPWPVGCENHFAISNSTELKLTVAQLLKKLPVLLEPYPELHTTHHTSLSPLSRPAKYPHGTQGPTVAGGGCPL